MKHITNIRNFKKSEFFTCDGLYTVEFSLTDSARYGDYMAYVKVYDNSVSIKMVFSGGHSAGGKIDDSELAYIEQYIEREWSVI